MPQTTRNPPGAGRRASEIVDRAGEPIGSENTSSLALPQLVCEWPKNIRESIRVTLDQFNGRDVVDVRCWYWDRSGELKPGRTGLALSTRHLKQLAQALTEAAKTAEEHGLIDRRIER